MGVRKQYHSTSSLNIVVIMNPCYILPHHFFLNIQAAKTNEFLLGLTQVH